jgi:PmbA protein
MDFQTFKQAVAAAAAAHGISDYELYYSTSETTDISVFRDEINEFTASVSGGVCLRCRINGKMGYASTEELSQPAAQALVQRAWDNAASLETQEEEFFTAGGQTYETVTPALEALPSTEELIDTVQKAQRAAYGADEAVVDGTVTEGFAQKLRIALSNSQGLELSYENALTGLLQMAVVSVQDEVADAYRLKLGALDSIDLEALAAETTAKARGKLGADVAPTGVYPVVFSPEAMASLLQTYAPVFSSENAQKGLSLLAGQEGNVIAAETVTLVDDPFYPGSPLPMPFDAEGTPTQRKNVLENGVLKTLLYNQKTAAAAHRSTTGNAAKASFSAKVSVSPFTFYLAPGNLTEAALLEKAENGVYINALGGLHAGANVISGDFSLQSAGFRIENGQKTKPVKSFTVAGNFFDLLKHIQAVSDTVDLPMAMGTPCFGSPSVLVDELTIAGK